MSAVESPLRLHLLGLFGWVYFCDYDKKKGKKTSGTHVFPFMAHQNAISLIWGGNKEEKSCCSQMTELSLISCFDYFSHFFSWMWFTVCLFVFVFFFFFGINWISFFSSSSLWWYTYNLYIVYHFFFFFLGLTGHFFFPFLLGMIFLF